MAKPIAPTPILEGKEAYDFLMEMLKPSSDKKKRMLREIREKHLPDLFD